MSEEYTSEEIPDYVLEAQRRNAVRRFFKWFILLVLLVSSIGFAAYLWSAGKRAKADQDVLDRDGQERIAAFLEEVRSGSFDDAYRSTSAGFKQRMSRGQFEDYLARNKEVLQEPFQQHHFRIERTALAAFGQKVTGHYRGWRKAVTGRQESVTLTVLLEDGEVKVHELSISQ